MPGNAFIDILAINRTKEGWESAIKDAATSSKKIENSVDNAAGSATEVTDKIGHTGEVAAKMAINLLQAFGVSGEKAKVLEGILRQVDDGFDALGKAAHLASVANTIAASSNVAVGTSATGAAIGVKGLTAAMIANPVTATLVAIAAAAAAVYVAFQSWDGATETVGELNDALEQQGNLLERLLKYARSRIDTESTLAQIEKETLQRQEVANIKGILNVQTAKEAAIIAATEADIQKNKNNLLQKEIDFQAERLETLKKIFEQNQKDGKEQGDTGAELIETQKNLEASLQKQSEIRKQIANFEEQARAANDRALAIPEEEAKAEEESKKKQLKNEEELAKKRAKFAADRLAAEDLYATAVDDMHEKNKKEAEDEKKADEERKKVFKEKIADAEKLAKFESRFVGLEDLTRGIQLTAINATKKDRDDESVRQSQIEMKDLMKEFVKMMGKTLTLEEEAVVHAADMVEKIDKLGTLA